MNISSVSSQNLAMDYQQLSTGKRINSAADDAAGLAIANKLETQSNGYDQGYENASISQAMINVADGGLSSINDYLQRIRELSVQASNSAIYGDAALNAIQQEIDQMKEGITDVAKNTQFNTKNLLDGSMSDTNIATNPDGGGLKINMPNATLEALGIADFDVRGKFNIADIDKAIEKVSMARGELGASSNRLDSVMSYNSYASYNLTSAQSNIEDLDFGKAISEMQKKNIVEQYQMMMQKKQLETEEGSMRLLKF